ncbi:branched-chain amino acid ABC transporter permease [Actinomadura chibensis]|uniref:Branched-chain amino acid ABC transporter permease n=1 Tax=Actinomadura chibensis TaxID=392828 RepID=A0A5D0ND51_9ACTN|nr:branched-chain amino acid ABC transporter permease [Actinomadura chibensis]TYB42326.1 branched-chain amino acid ABC transporter permease [Actinomadura chibensis]
MSATDRAAAGTGRARPGRAAPPPIRPAIFDRRQREWVVAVAVLGALLPLLVQGLYGTGIMITSAIYGLLALGFYFQLTLAGQFSLATVGFYAIGAYTSVWASQHGGFLVGLVTAVFVTGLIGTLLKLALSRSPLIQFAIATLAFGELTMIVMRNWTGFTGGGTGRYGIETKIFGLALDTPREYFYLAFGVLVAGIALAVLVERSPAQRDLIFARTMGDVARTTGLPTRRLQAVAFGIGAGYMGAAGSLLAHTSAFIDPSSFHVEISLDVLLMLLLGGSGSIWGPPVGAVILTLVPEWLRDLADYKELVYAVIILLVIVMLPGGLASLPEKVRARLDRRPPGGAVKR